MKLSIYTLLFILSFFVFEVVYSQNLDYFERITTDNGLSQSDINTIFQDKEGFMWFGTHDGLNRYDGYSFKVFKPNLNKPNSITSNLIFDLEQDQNGSFWIATTGGGLIFFDKTTEKFVTYKHNENDIKSINSNYISTVYCDKENRLWIGSDMGLNMIDLKDLNKPIEFKSFTVHQEPFFTDQNVREVSVVYEDSKGQIWIGGYGGIYKMSREPNGEVYFRHINESIGLPNYSVGCINEKNGQLLIGTERGLYIQSKIPNSLEVEKISDGSFTNILISNNIIWAGTQDGFLKFESSSQSEIPKLKKKFVYDPINPNSLSKNIVKSLFKDKTGIIWVGTDGGGVNKFDPNRKQFHHVRKTLEPNSLSYDNIRAFHEDTNNNLWVGTDGGGLSVLLDGEKNNKFINLNTIKKIYAIEEVKRGDKKILLFGGRFIPSMFELDITDPKKISRNKIISFSDFNHSIFSILSDSNENIWIGTYGGGVHRWKLDHRTNTYIKDIFIHDTNDSKSISNDIIRNICEDKSGNIWFATGNGLNRLLKNEANKKYPKFDVFKNIPTDPKSLTHNYILSIFEDSTESLWIGSFGGGLNKLVKNESNDSITFKSYTEADGLPNNVIKGILEDDQEKLWLSTNKGLSRFDKKQEEFKNYDASDGLQSNEFQELAHLKKKNGELLFGGVNGYNSFNPRDLRENTFKPQTVITKLFISNKEVSVGEEFDGGEILLDKVISKAKEVQLDYFQNNISFEFSALHYVSPQKNKYVYKLEGFDKDWQSTTANKRFAGYTNLSAGTYTFNVKSSNNDGLWNETPAKIKFIISPPFWLSNWAYLFYVFLVLFILWSIQSYLNLRSQKRAAIKVQKEIEEVNKLKLQFFTNISHEFKTPITLILNPIEELLESVGKNLSLKPKLEVIQRNANSLLRLVHQLLEFRKIEVGETKLCATKANIINFVKEITFSFRASAKKSQIDISFESELKAKNIWFDWDKLEKILNNLIYNAIKFTPAGGNIVIRVSKPKGNKLIDIQERNTQANYLLIEVEDNGVGIEKSQQPYVFQRFYQVGQSSNKNKNGSGIGLAITKDLVDLHHGVIELNSEVGKGTRFTIKLPLGKSHLLPEEIIEPTVSEIIDVDNIEIEEIEKGLNTEFDVATSDNFKNSILVIDDNADIRQLVKEEFCNKYKVFEAENGKEGLNISLKEIPDLVISDVLMPEMDGVEFCHMVKTNIRTSHIPVILLTALNSVEHRIKGLESGADAYIPKPFKMRLLSVRVGKLIETRELMRKHFEIEKELTPEKITLNSLDEEFIKKIMDLMEVNMSNESYWIDELTSDMNTSRSTFFRKLKKLTGQTPNDFIRIIRLKRAAQLLEQNELTIAQVSYMVGFGDPGYFGKCFRKAYGMAPSRYSNTVN